LGEPDDPFQESVAPTGAGHAAYLGHVYFRLPAGADRMGFQQMTVQFLARRKGLLGVVGFATEKKVLELAQVAVGNSI
jgi:hypothetical protein